jgi:hypothetical protein
VHSPAPFCIRPMIHKSHQHVSPSSCKGGRVRERYPGGLCDMLPPGTFTARQGSSAPWAVALGAVAGDSVPIPTCIKVGYRSPPVNIMLSKMPQPRSGTRRSSGCIMEVLPRRVIRCCSGFTDYSAGWVVTMFHNETECVVIPGRPPRVRARRGPRAGSAALAPRSYNVTIQTGP